MSVELHARFRLNYAPFQLDVDLSLPGQGISVLFGASGSGKTTLLRCIAGLERAPDGLLTLGDTVWQDSSRRLFVPTHQRNLGYVFQEANLFPHLTVLSNLQYGRQRSRNPQSVAALDQAIELLAIGHLLNRKPDRLSGGERQRVAIARALAPNPSVLLMDEPLAALDETRKQEILPFLLTLHQALQLPVIYVTHALQEVNQLADHLVVLESGKEVVSGELSKVLTQLDSPLAVDKQAASVWQARIVSHEPEYHLSCAAFAGGHLSLPYLALAEGTAVRIRIYARDVSIALTAPQATSILNILPAKITGIRQRPEGQVLVQLSVGCEVLLAHITQKSAQALGLEVGLTVYAQIKGTSLVNTFDQNQIAFA